ncbi:MAG: DUF1552 domain-containing protein [Acidimicrobiia bacterium]|nr:DUF1552 domain-containing protein [Acidimicrobiia bacterium]
MIISRKTLSRRTILRGAGAAIALPLLDGMVPALTPLRLTAAAPVRRLGVLYAANGMAMDYWRPKAEGRLELTPILQPLADFRDRMTVVSGLGSRMAEGKDTAVHARIQATWLTGCSAKRTEGPDIHLGVSMDQIAAQAFSRETELASLELAMESSDLAGACLPGYSCAYNNTVSWRDATTPLPMEHNPRAVFERLFGSSPDTSPEARLAAIEKRRSILDAVTDKVARLEQDLGPVDRAKLGQYLDAVRDVERRMDKAEAQAARELPDVEKPSGSVPERWDEHAALMFDLLQLAWQTDLTRVFAFALGRELSVRTFNEIGVPDAHHPLSHHQEDPTKILKLSKVQTYQMQGFARFLRRLAETSDGDGTLLDGSVFFYGAGISNSNLHYHYDLPALVVAGRNLAVTGGQHLVHTDEPLANLQLALLDKLDLPVARFGDSTGRLNLLTGL